MYLGLKMQRCFEPLPLFTFSNHHHHCCCCCLHLQFCHPLVMVVVIDLVVVLDQGKPPSTCDIVLTSYVTNITVNKTRKYEKKIS